MQALADAEHALHDAESAYAATHTQAATELVALFKALGGGRGGAQLEAFRSG